MPTSGPVITGGEDGYDFGDNVTLNCTSSKSKPAPMLKWFINGKHVSKQNSFGNTSLAYKIGNIQMNATIFYFDVYHNSQRYTEINIFFNMFRLTFL